MGPVADRPPAASVDENRCRPDRHWTAHFSPVRCEQRVERLIEVASTAEERSPQDTFLDCAELLQGAIAAPVQDCRTRFEAMHAERVEHEVEHQPRALEEQTTAPERGAE